MADLTRILEWRDPIIGPELEFYRGLIYRLVTGVGPWLEFDECLALVYLFDYYEFVFEDGFTVASELYDSGHASVVATCFCEDRRIDAWTIEREYLNLNHTDKFALLVEDVKRRLLRCPGLSLV